MTYYINLGGILLYGIKSVNDDSEREITSYDGIGQGFFPVPESRKLRTWTIECEMTEKNLNRLPNWSAASKVFTAFEVLLATKDPSRFIFVSDNRSESMSGYLTGYSKKEEYPGVYSVTVKVMEYKAAGVKTTDVPYIKRPGKAPAIPKTVVFNSKTTPYKLKQDEKKDGEIKHTGIVADFHLLESQTKPNISGTNGATKSTGGSGYSGGGKGGSRGEISDSKTGKPVINPAMLKDDQAYSYSVAESFPKSSVGKAAANAISTALSSFVERIKSGQGIVNKGIGENN